MAVTVEQEQLDHCHVALNIQVPPEDVQKAIDSVYKQFAKRTSVPGFRPGKAPAQLLKKFIDEGRVREMAMDQVLNNAYRDALRQAHVHPYAHAEPQVELPEEQIKPEEGFSFKATVATEPHVHLGELEGLTARRVTTKISDEDVQKELDRIRESAASYEQTEEAADDGTRIRATVLVTVDGQQVEEASFPDPTLIQVGANLPELDEGVRGMRPGEEKTFDFVFPDDFTDEGLRGKTATAKVNVSEVWRRTVPEATDEFAKRAGFDTMDALTEHVRGLLQAQADALAEQELNESLVQELIRRSHVHFPDEMIERQVSARMADLIKALERRGLTLDQYLEHEQKDLAALQDELRQDAVEGLTNTLTLVEFARDNELAPTDREVEDEVKLRAEAENVKTSQMRRLLNDTGEIDMIRHRIMYRKVADALKEKAEIREVEG